MHYEDDRLYIGEFKDDMMHGIGEFHWPDGKKFLGRYERNKKNGLGLYIWPGNEKMYMGFWKDGKQHGLGFMVSKTTVKRGQWEHGKRVKWIHDPWLFCRQIEVDHPEYEEFFERKPMDVVTYYKSLFLA